MAARHSLDDTCAYVDATCTDAKCTHARCADANHADSECASLQGSLEVLLRMPPVSVTVTNPPMPKLRECNKRSVVLCGIDINGARWPRLIADAVADDIMRVQIAIARTVRALTLYAVCTLQV